MVTVARKGRAGGIGKGVGAPPLSFTFIIIVINNY